jgi:hypothetical protein
MSPRPRSGALHAIAAFTLAAHAALIGLAWRDAGSTAPRPALRVAMRLVAAPPTAARVPVAERPARPAAAPRRAPARPDAPRRAVAAKHEPVAGVAFGPPRWGLPGTAPAQWMNPPAPLHVPAVVVSVAQAAQAQAARDAARWQIADALQRALPPAPAADGHCALLPAPAAALVCDDETLRQALAPREAALAGLLAAHRALEPQAGGLSISVAQGRYTVAWDAAPADQRLIGASVTSTPRDVTVTAPGL